MNSLNFIVIECPTLVHPVNGSSSCANNSNPGYDSRCNLTCDGGFGLTSAGKFTCAGTDLLGTWTPSPIPTCEGWHYYFTVKFD